MIVARRADLDNALFVQLGRLLVERRDARLVVSVKTQTHVHDAAAHVARLRQPVKDIEHRRGGELGAVVVFTNAGKDIDRRNGNDLVGERRASPACHAKHAAVAGLGGYDARHMGAMGAVEGHFVGAVQIAVASERLEGHLARLHVGPNDLAASAHIEGALQIGMADRSARIEHGHFHGLGAASRTCQQTPRLWGFHGTQIPLLASQLIASCQRRCRRRLGRGRRFVEAFGHVIGEGILHGVFGSGRFHSGVHRDLIDDVDHRRIASFERRRLRLSFGADGRGNIGLLGNRGVFLVDDDNLARNIAEFVDVRRPLFGGALRLVGIGLSKHGLCARRRFRGRPFNLGLYPSDIGANLFGSTCARCIRGLQIGHHIQNRLTSSLLISRRSPIAHGHRIGGDDPQDGRLAESTAHRRRPGNGKRKQDGKRRPEGLLPLAEIGVFHRSPLSAHAPEKAAGRLLSSPRILLYLRLIENRQRAGSSVLSFVNRLAASKLLPLCQR